MSLHVIQISECQPLSAQSDRHFNSVSEALGVNIGNDFIDIREFIHGRPLDSIRLPNPVRNVAKVTGEHAEIIPANHRPDRIELHEHELISFESVSAANNMAADPPDFKEKSTFKNNKIKALAPVLCATGIGATTEGSDNGR